MKSELLEDLKSSVRNPAWLCFLWVGMTAGISFIGVPAVFTADLLSRPETLDAARVIFAALTEIIAICQYLEDLHPEPRIMGRDAKEKALVLMWNAKVEQQGFSAIAEAFRNSAKGFRNRALTGPNDIAQLPELAERAQQIASGTQPARSMAHAFYSVLEIIKVVLLLTLGFRALRSRSDLHRLAE